MDWITPQFLQGAITGFVIVGAVVYFAPRKKPEPPSSQKVTPSCGCIFCDLDLERHQTTTMTAPGQEVGFFHQTKHGDVPCTAKQYRSAMSKDWEMEKPAMAICDRLGPSTLPHEILKLEEATAALIVDIDGVDYVLTLQRVPKQRPRPH